MNPLYKIVAIFLWVCFNPVAFCSVNNASSIGYTQVLLQSGANSYKFNHQYSTYAQFGAHVQGLFDTPFELLENSNPIYFGAELMASKLFGPVNNSNSYFIEYGPMVHKNLGKQFNGKLFLPVRYEKLSFYPKNQEKHLWFRARVQLEYLFNEKISFLAAIGTQSLWQIGPRLALDAHGIGLFTTEILYEQMDLGVRRRALILKSGKSF